MNSTPVVQQSKYMAPCCKVNTPLGIVDRTVRTIPGIEITENHQNIEK